MSGDCCEGAVEGGEGLSLEEAEGFHGCDLDVVLVRCRGSMFCVPGSRSYLCLLMRIVC